MNTLSMFRRAASALSSLVLSGVALAQGAPTLPALPTGVTAETRAAIDNGLAWLARNQAADGSWRNAGGYGTYPVAMTGLCGMAFLSSGSTPTRGPYWRNVRAAVSFLVKNADAGTGLISTSVEEHHSMYGHGFATLFLASVYGMEEDVRGEHKLRQVLDRAVSLISAAQSRAGGWIYTPESTDDEGSVTVTQVQALRACRMAGIAVDKATIDRAVDYIKRCQNADGGIAYKLAMAGSSSQPAITAAGVAVLYNAGIYDDQPFVEKAVQYCKRHLQVAVDTTGHHFYTQLYWSQALYQRGGEDWDAYYREASTYLRKQQRKDGSWNGDGVGSTYGTAIGLIILQLPYALTPIYQR
ncbi:MAG: prenyltransferase/squalene oxidase repeat-containing protein [Planctomycetota bacterium]